MSQYQPKQIPTDVPVELFRMYTGKTGNLYMPGIYQPGGLPKAAYNTYYVTPVVAIINEPKEAVVADADIKNGAFKVEDVVKRKENPTGVIEDISINQQLKKQDKHLKAKIAKPVKAPALQINTATHEDLTGLNGVGKATADKVLELRELSGFTDYEDLNSRVPLAMGKDWTAFEVSFE